MARCENVVRTYERGGQGLLTRSRELPTVRALDGVSLTVDRGEFVGIAGPSGSGKSTLLHLLGALDTPTAGRVTVVGRDISTLSSRERTALRREYIGVVFQRFHLLPSLSARANVTLPLIEQGLSKRDRQRRADRLLSKVGLADRADHKPSALSGGEQQRVAVARALACEPEIVVADEPTGELDTETGGRVLELLREVADARAVVVASHDENALGTADRVVKLLDGTVRDA